MKSSALLILLNLFCITILQSQTSRNLDFRIVSSGTGYGIQGSQFIIELQMKSNDGIAEMGTGNLTITFNSDAMTLNTDDSYVNPTVANYNPFGFGTAYSNAHVYSPETGYVQSGIAFNSSFAALAYDIPTTWLDFAHVVFDIDDTSESTNIEWDDFTNATIFYAEDNTTAHVTYTQTGEIDTPLPVSLQSFTAETTNVGASIQWSTYSECNNLGWNVYRSPSENFGQTTKVNPSLIEGAGTTSEISRYVYIDGNLDNETHDYWYWIESVDYSGNSAYYGSIKLQINNPDNPQAPDLSPQLNFLNNYPNPFNPSTIIQFKLKEASHADLAIYNIKGELVKKLLANVYISDDSINRVIWDGADTNGKLLGSGVYFYQLKAGSQSITNRMLMVK
jgi:hypothetical protein